MLTLHVLLENESASPDLACEHGLSLLLTCEDKVMLFDAGASDAFLRNAQVMDIDLDTVTDIVLSHGHHDHTGGLPHALRHFAERACRAGECSRIPMPEVVLHPDALLPRRRMSTEKDPGKQLGMSPETRTLLQDWPKHLITAPQLLTRNLFHLGEIPRAYPENQALLGELERPQGFEPDRILDDCALAYVRENVEGKDLVIIAGCAHAGIINVIEHAKAVTGVDKVHTVIGGLHMKDASDEVKGQTLRYFDDQDIDILYGCHCTGKALDGVARQRHLHTGDYLEF